MRRIGAPRATILRSLLCVIAAVGVVLVPGAASAAPTPASVEKQIDEQWNKLEPLIEQYNKVHEDLLAKRKQLKKIDQRLTPLQLQVDVAMSQVSGMASDAYKQGSPGALQSMLITGSPTALTQKLAFVDQLARAQQEQVADVVVLRDKYAKDRKDLATITAEVEARDKDIATRKGQIQKKVDDLQKLRVEAYGSSGVADKNFRIGNLCPIEYTQEKGNRAAQKACSLIGKPYIFGSAGPRGYDCSGLTQVAWGSVGVGLSHFTGTQINAGRGVSRSELEAGDLIFYGSPVHHVALYVGGGLMVHAPHTGDYVRMAKVDSPGSPVEYRRPG